MAIFNSYVKLPEGITTIFLRFSYDFPIKPTIIYESMDESQDGFGLPRPSPVAPLRRLLRRRRRRHLARPDAHGLRGSPGHGGVPLRRRGTLGTRGALPPVGNLGLCLV